MKKNVKTWFFRGITCLTTGIIAFRGMLPYSLQETPTFAASVTSEPRWNPIYFRYAIASYASDVQDIRSDGTGVNDRQRDRENSRYSQTFKRDS